MSQSLDARSRDPLLQSTNPNSVGITDYNTLPASTLSVISTPYIFASPSTSPATFGTPAQFVPQYQGNNQPLALVYDTSYDFAINQQTTSTDPSIPVPFVPNLGTATAISPYVQQPLHAFPYEDYRNLGRLGVDTGPTSHGSGSSFGLAPSNMPDYPSPRSEMSGQSRSPSLSIYPIADTTSTAIPYSTIPASKISSSYGSPESVRSEEPSRNDQGLIYCSHKDCASDPPTFTRKCEWKKHMDKHNRPYVCDEPGCEKILGFTYQGGLLRHRREVHKYRGGPKASCMCPHKDCKRSTGTGFSRRENLVEHLRRLHGGGGEEGVKEVATSTSLSGQGRKRRRETSDQGTEEKEHSDPDTSKRHKPVSDAETTRQNGPTDTPENASDSVDLRAQVKSLQFELQQKDERLRKLEETVARLAGK